MSPMPISPGIPLSRAPVVLQSRKSYVGSVDLSRAPSEHFVACPMVRQDVALGTCESCSHGHDWVHDQASDTVLLRCSFLARDSQ